MVARVHLRPSRTPWLVLLLLSFLCCWANAWTVTTRSGDTQQKVLKTPSDARQVMQVRVRASIDTDLSAVAEVLAAASLELTQSAPRLGFLARLDQLWARSDIEKLLQGRLRAIREGQRTWRQRQSDGGDRLSVLWRSDSFRKLVSQAAKETGEDSVWRHHDYRRPPLSSSWLQHLQMTAVDVADVDERVVGFCEIAMLSVPHRASGNAQQETNAYPSQSWSSRFSPAVLNLCVNPSYRRRGLATRLLRTAERYVHRHWASRSLGLFVHTNNSAAVALYESLGYRPQAAPAPSHPSGSDRSDGMVYMVKSW